MTTTPTPTTTAPGAGTPPPSEWRAIQLSLAVGILLFLIKATAYGLTGSTAVLSDAVESIVNIGAAAFGAYCLRYSYHPPDESHPYGHERVTFLSAGMEGGLVMAAAVFICFEAGQQIYNPEPLMRLDWGVVLLVVAGLVNGGVGWWLLRVGRRTRNLILEADGKHLLTDLWTSVVVIIGLLAVRLTSITWLDPVFALMVALLILVVGYRLVSQSVAGLMDRSDPERDAEIRAILDDAAGAGVACYHALRHHNTGRTTWVEVHLQFPGEFDLRSAHREATLIEQRLKQQMRERVVITTHLEPLEEHEKEHRPPQRPGNA